MTFDPVRSAFAPPGDALRETASYRPRSTTPRLANLQATKPRTVTALVGLTLAICVTLLGLAYRLAPVPSKALEYFEAAWRLPQGTGADHDSLQYGLIVPIWLAQRVFGYSQAAYLVVPLLAGALLAVSVYLIGFLLFNRVVGIAAALLAVGNSIMFDQLTQPLPDLLATSLLCAALVLVIAIRQRRLVVTATRRRQTLALAATGVLLGWSFLSKALVVFCWPLIPLLLWRRISARRAVWIVAPVALVTFGELCWNALTVGDALGRFQALMAYDGTQGGSVHSAVPETVRADAEFVALDRQWDVTQPATALGAAPEGLWLKIGLLATAIGVMVDRRLAFLAGWATAYTLPVIALGDQLGEDTPAVRLTEQHQWLPLVPAMALSASAGVWLVAHNRSRVVRWLREYAHVVAACVTVAMVAIPIGIAQHARMTGHDESDSTASEDTTQRARQLEELRTWLADHAGGVETLWAPRQTWRLVRVFANGTYGGRIWPGHLKLWEPATSRPQPADGDYVVFYGPYSRTCAPCRADAEALLGRPPVAPPTWQPAFVSRERIVEIYQVR
ncbi:MAG TPA: glycosyltransferase family 39 protein [Actinopolymorphaceae bacterium]|jgi:hypothetical protein